MTRQSSTKTQERAQAARSSTPDLSRLSRIISEEILDQRRKVIEDLTAEDGPLSKRLHEYEVKANATASRASQRLEREASKAQARLEGHIHTKLEEIAQRMRTKLEISFPDDATIEIDGVHQSFYRLIRKASARIHAVMVGPAGGGKGYAAQQVAQSLDKPFYAKSCSVMDTKSDWIGFIDAAGTYHGTPFRWAFEHGGVMFIDEMDAANPAVFVLINAALADGQMAFPDGMVKQHEDFIVLAAANTWGRGADRQYRGRAVQDAASLNRFAKVAWEYDEQLERSIAPHDDWCAYVQAARKVVFDHGMKYVVSPRQTIAGGKELLTGAPLPEVAHDHLYADWNIDDIEKLDSLMQQTANGIAHMHSEIARELGWRG